MGNRNWLNNLVFTLAFIIILTPLAACTTSRTTASKIGVQDGGQVALNDHGLVQFDAREIAPEVSATITTQEISIRDGSTILENNCTQCHVVKSLLQIKKSRVGWEDALALMETMGVQLSETEKITLIDYLATNEEP
jgi:hypothetical protein